MEVSISCAAADEQEELFRGRTDVDFPDPLQVVELQFAFPNVQFPRPGEYRFQLLADGHLLRERKFFVSYLISESEAQEC
jgi:hypothetical protein